MSLPLEGVKVLAVEQYGAGPFGTQYLVNQGAEVVKIENPSDGGDVSRSLGPYFIEGAPETTESVFFQGLNHNKKSVTLDLKKAEGRAIFRKLAKDADAVATNLRGDVPAKLGLTYADLKDVNPQIVCTHLTAYGRDGDRAGWPGYDYMMQAEAGYFSLTGEPGAPPARFGLSMIDFMTGLSLAYALTTAVFSAHKTGLGRDMDVSLFDTALYNLNYIGLWQLNNGHTQDRAPRSAHAALTPCQLYRTKDGWIYLMCNKEKFWPILCQYIGREDLTDDSRFLTFRERLENRDTLTEILDDELMSDTTAEWLRRFDGKVPAAPILDVQQALENPFVTDTGRLQAVPLGEGASAKIIRNPIRNGAELELARPPILGEHTTEELRNVGLIDSEIEKLQKNSIV